MCTIEFFGPKSSVVQPGDLRWRVSWVTRPIRGLFFFGWVGQNEVVWRRWRWGACLTSKQSLGDGQAAVVTLPCSVAGPGHTVWPTAMRSPPVLAPPMKMMHQSPAQETNRFSQGLKGEWIQVLGSPGVRQQTGRELFFFPLLWSSFLFHVEWMVWGINNPKISGLFKFQAPEQKDPYSFPYLGRSRTKMAFSCHWSQ